ncbi:hypothetical protein FQA39_LY10984 [Lamprigera yunnana]|nr:hypothetical protein FQA39_LY10984 [Lamprigera yunnana]
MYAKNAWTAHHNDVQQQLIINFGQATNITQIWTQDRTHSSEYVIKYSISYGFNGYDYTAYKESDNDYRLFKANTDGDLSKISCRLPYKLFLRSTKNHKCDPDLLVYGFNFWIFFWDVRARSGEELLPDECQSLNLSLRLQGGCDGRWLRPKPSDMRVSIPATSG